MFPFPCLAANSSYIPALLSHLRLMASFSIVVS